MVWIVCVFALFLSSCQQKAQERHYTEVTVQASQAELAPMPAAASEDPHAGLDMASMNMPGIEDSAVKAMFAWDLPEGWKQDAGKGMRLASFHLIADEKAIDCSVISLSGLAGGLEPNLRRWMGQINLEPSPSDFATLIAGATSIKNKDGQEGKVFDFTTIQPKAQASDKSMVVVMFATEASTLFVKMTGTMETVKNNKDDFFKFAQSIKKDDSAPSPSADPHAGLDMKDPHAGMDMAAMGSVMEAAAPSESMFNWTVPEGWVEAPASHMRLATFHLASDPKAMDFSIISLGGPAGGLEANLTRWAGQLGLDASPETVEKLIQASSTVKTQDGMDIKVFDFTSIQTAAQGTDKSMMAAMMTMDQSTIFIKMTGTVDIIKQNKEAFLKFCGSMSHK